MRGADERSGSLFSYVDLESRVPADHPLRAIRVIVNAAVAELDGEFAAMYALYTFGYQNHDHRLRACARGRGGGS